MNLWSLLPNAHHIDWVLASLKTNSDIWASDFNATCNTTWIELTRRKTLGVDWYAARDAALDAARDAAYKAAWDVAWIAAYDAARDATLVAVRNAARDATWNAILALIAYDDCDQYLSMSYEKLLTYAVISEKPQALLLLSMKWVQEHERLSPPAEERDLT